MYISFSSTHMITHLSRHSLATFTHTPARIYTTLVYPNIFNDSVLFGISFLLNSAYVCELLLRMNQSR